VFSHTHTHTHTHTHLQRGDGYVARGEAAVDFAQRLGAEVAQPHAADETLVVRIAQPR
jgi:hypothetical protein